MTSTEGRPPRGRERRRHPRVTTDLPLTVSLAEGTFEARLRDLSRAGVCFFLDRPIEEMTVLQMSFHLPGAADQGAIEGRGVVVRCEPLSPHVDHYEVAVFLNDLSDSQRDRLDRYVATHGT